MIRIRPRSHADQMRIARLDAERDHARELRLKLARLRDREASLETIASEAPRQLERIRACIAAVEGSLE